MIMRQLITYLSCHFARQVWNWVESKICCNLDLSSIHSLISFCMTRRSSQASDIVPAAVTFAIFFIWSARNSCRFDNQKLDFTSFDTSIHLSGNFSVGTMNNSMLDFRILKNFDVPTNPRKADSIKEVIWRPPRRTWIKCNTEGSERKPWYGRLWLFFHR